MAGQMGPFIHSNSTRIHAAPKLELMVQWLDTKVDMYCEYIPHLQLMCLPYGVDKTEWYRICKNSLAVEWNVPEDEVPAQSYFLSIMAKKYPFVKISRRITLGRCFICIKFKLLLKSGDLSKERREEINSEKKAHTQAMLAERAQYKRISASSRNPENSTLSFILDKGNGPAIPHLAQHPKSWATMTRPKTSLFAFINHGRQMKFHIPNLDEFPDDPNYAMSLIYAQLLEHAKATGSLPLYFHVQVDNCSKENKNRWLLGLFTLLAGLKIFKRITGEMLGQGHTHEDIDAEFTAVSNGLTSFDCICWSEFGAFLRRCFRGHKNQPIILSMPTIYDWKSWLDPCLRDMSGFMKFRSFKFEVLFLLSLSYLLIPFLIFVTQFILNLDGRGLTRACHVGSGKFDEPDLDRA